MVGKIAVSLLVLLLIWGNLVAGLKYGLACPDWPLCHGKVLPPLRWDIYMEFMHRVIGGVTSIFLVILAYKRLRAYKGGAKSIPVIMVLLLLLQIFVGGFVVLLGLPVDLTTFHFANAIIIFVLTLYMVYFDGVSWTPVFSAAGVSAVFFFLSLLVVVQLVLGAYVRHSEAGLACPDFPTCLGFWVPPNLAGIVLNHFAHRTLAYIITLCVLGLVAASLSYQSLAAYRNRIYIVLGLILVQILLGVAVVHTKLYFAVTAVHLAVALLILGVLLDTWFRVIAKSSV